jgi:hypothetical protein
MQHISRLRSRAAGYIQADVSQTPLLNHQVIATSIFLNYYNALSLDHHRNIMANSSTELKRCYECGSCGRITVSRDAQSGEAICTRCYADEPSVDRQAGNINEAVVATPEDVPENQDIYAALKDVPLLMKSIKSGQKKSDSVVRNRQTREDIQQLIAKYGLEDLKVRVKQLATQGVFVDPSIAQQMFPDLSGDVPAAEAVGKSIEEDRIPGAVNPDELILEPPRDTEAPTGEAVLIEGVPNNAVNRM